MSCMMRWRSWGVRRGACAGRRVDAARGRWTRHAMEAGCGSLRSACHATGCVPDASLCQLSRRRQSENAPSCGAERTRFASWCAGGSSDRPHDPAVVAGALGLPQIDVDVALAALEHEGLHCVGVSLQGSRARSVRAPCSRGSIATPSIGCARKSSPFAATSCGSLQVAAARYGSRAEA